jgi:hypothetical protein
MRNLILRIATSLDGFITRLDGRVDELDLFLIPTSLTTLC